MNPAYVVDGVTYEYQSFMSIIIGEYEICSISYGCHGIKFHGLYLKEFKDNPPKTILFAQQKLETIWTNDVYHAKRWHGGHVEHAIRLAERLRDVSS